VKLHRDRPEADALVAQLEQPLDRLTPERAAPASPLRLDLREHRSARRHDGSEDGEPIDGWVFAQERSCGLSASPKRRIQRVACQRQFSDIRSPTIGTLRVLVYLVYRLEWESVTNLVELGNLLTLQEAAEVLKQHPETIRLKVKRGTIPSVRLGDGPNPPIRIPRDQLEERLAGASSFRPADTSARGHAKSTLIAQRGTNGNSNTGRQ
jgi:excisionase family DNA binding protein